MHTEVDKYITACLPYCCFTAEIVPPPTKLAAEHHPVTRPFQLVVVGSLIVECSLAPVEIAMSCL